MSEQRRTRKELRTGLYQFLMMMYTSYLESQSQEDAKSFVQQELQHQYRLFFSEDIDDEILFLLLEERIVAIKDKLIEARQSKEEDLVLHYTEQIEDMKKVMSSIKKGK